eukprot:scaffold462_cov195-Pinguiococcus_pyrenoidosus.AAC.58
MAPFKASPTFTLELLLNPVTYVLVLLDFALWLILWLVSVRVSACKRRSHHAERRRGRDCGETGEVCAENGRFLFEEF